MTGLCFFFQELTTIDPGSSKTAGGSSNILMNSGPISCNRGEHEIRYCIITILYYLAFHSPSLSFHSDSLRTQIVRGILSWCFGCRPCTDCRGCGSAAASCSNSPCADVPRESWEKWIFRSQSHSRRHLSFMAQWLKQTSHISGLPWAFCLPIVPI